MNHSLDNQSRKDCKQQLLSQQITLFQHLSMILCTLSERILDQDLSRTERRMMQQELASLKKASQSARSRLNTSRRSLHRSSHPRHDSS